MRDIRKPVDSVYAQTHVRTDIVNTDRHYSSGHYNNILVEFECMGITPIVGIVFWRRHGKDFEGE